MSAPAPASQPIVATVNGDRVERSVECGKSLAAFLRDDLGLTGTKVSCGVQVCGVCTVLVDGAPVSACTYFAADLDGRELLTVEGLAREGVLHPLQQAFLDHQGMQCGFCTPGFLMMATALLERQPDPSEQDVLEYLEGNICRCTGYRPIVSAIRQAAQVLADGDGDG